MRMVKVTQNILSLKMVVKNGAKLATVQSLKKKTPTKPRKKTKKTLLSTVYDNPHITGYRISFQKIP